MKFSKNTPRDQCEPSCPNFGSFVVGVNLFTLVDSGLNLQTNPDECISEGTMRFIAQANNYLFKAPATGCFTFSTCDQIYDDLAIAIFDKCNDFTGQIECLDDTPGCNYVIMSVILVS